MRQPRHFKFYLNYFKIKYLPIPDKEIKNWFLSKQFFFIVSTGRTGTKWLARILNSEKAHVLHEPVPFEGLAHIAACKNKRNAYDYVKNFRIKEIYLRNKNINEIDIFGEVNGNLRRHIAPLSKLLPNITIIHLIRNGKNVIRSVMNRNTFTDKKSIYFKFIPPEARRKKLNWKHIDNFEKMCWIWRWENEYMDAGTDNHVKFEDITSSYQIFKKQLTEKIGVDISENVWKEQINLPINKNEKCNFPSYEYWTKSEKNKFQKICGKMMDKYGYEI